MKNPQNFIGILTAAMCLSASSSNAAMVPGSDLTPSVWLDANQLSLNDGDAVGTWTDASGNGRDATQGTATRRPTYHTAVAGANNMPVVRFNTELQPGGLANQFMAFSGSLANTSDGVLSLYVVSFDSGLRSGANNRAVLVNTRPNSGTATGTLFGYGATPSIEGYAHVGERTSTGASVQTAPISDTGFNLIGLTRDGLTTTVFNYTDTDMASSTATWTGFKPSGMTTTQIGTEGGGHYLFGDIAEIIAFDGVSLTEEQHQQMVTYLGDKYDIAFAAVPEPSTYALLAGCVVLLGAIRFRRKN